MAVTKDDIQKTLRIRRCVNEYFKTTNETQIQAKELMPQFINNGIFSGNHKDGLPIREFLRHLDKEEQIKLIPQAQYFQKDKNCNWYFIKVQS